MIEYSSKRSPLISIAQTTWIQFQPNRTIEIDENSSQRNFYENPLTNNDTFHSIDQIEKEKDDQWIKTIPIEDQRNENESTIKSILKKSPKKHRIPSISEKRDSSLRSLKWNSIENEYRQKLEEIPSVSLYPHRLFQSNIDSFQSKFNVYIKPFRFEEDKSQLIRRKERISWSPTIKESSTDSTKKKKSSLKKNLSNSSSLNSYHSLIHENDFKDFSSLIDDEEENSSLTKIQSNRQDNSVIQYYENLLEKMNKADQQLASLDQISQGEEHRTMNSVLKTFVVEKIDSSSKMNSNQRSTEKNEFFSPLILQMCFIILILFNLLILFFYNDLSMWWNDSLLSTFPSDDQ